MELYIGGFAQGKLEYVRRQHPGEKFRILDGADRKLEDGRMDGGRLLINHFHGWVKGLIAEGKDAEALTEMLAKEYPDCIIICDEVGNGIVPVEPFEREYRERLGRILIGLAAKAERVERVSCGIGLRVK
ncbi:MAG: bifunctional adenosylcobinamide kinase/adenosylcobinamide-phosphate guanylyltransferase [Lachnospiraceae bacterium]|nr:bifunctional adenosylcobinamide kinase/adenosylcobinamide-phosphate guanylyltransferase [Lachnospiraceae bacterium]